MISIKRICNRVVRNSFLVASFACFHLLFSCFLFAHHGVAFHLLGQEHKISMSFLSRQLWHSRHLLARADIPGKLSAFNSRHTGYSQFSGTSDFKKPFDSSDRRSDSNRNRNDERIRQNRYDSKPRFTESRDGADGDEYAQRLSNAQIKRARYASSSSQGGRINNQGGNNRIADLPLAEPSYGYYDGDHLYGVQPVRLALISKRRVISELLVQEGMDTKKKKV